MKKVSLLIAVREQKVLLQHKDDGAPNWPNTWCLFGGAVELGETHEQALERELEEELEWAIAGYRHTATDESDGIHREAYLLETQRDADELRKSQREGDDLGFISEGDLTTITIAPPHLRLVLGYFSNLRRPAG